MTAPGEHANRRIGAGLNAADALGQVRPASHEENSHRDGRICVLNRKIGTNMPNVSLTIGCLCCNAAKAHLSVNRSLSEASNAYVKEPFAICFVEGVNDGY